MSLVVVSLVVVIFIVGLFVVLAIGNVEQRLAIATDLLEELTRLKDIDQRLAGLERELNQIRRAVSSPSAGYTDAPPTTVKQTLGIAEANGKDVYDRAVGMDIDSRGLDQFESEQSIAERKYFPKNRKLLAV
jgi:hypothetical protein